MASSPDFTPEWYRQQQLRRRGGVRHVGLIAVMVLAMTSWAVVQAVRLEGVRREVGQLAAARQTQAAAIGQLDAYQADLLAVEASARNGRQAVRGVPVHRVLAEFAGLLPDEACLVSLGLTCDRPGPDAPVDAGGERREITMTGWAADDAAIGRLLGRMSASCFERPQLRYARPAEVEGHRVREFRIDAALPLFK